MADRAYVRYPDDATDALLARAEAAIRDSARAVIVLDKAWRRLVEAIQQCDDHLARRPANDNDALPTVRENAR